MSFYQKAIHMRDSNYLVVNKKEMLDILKQLAVCMSEVMDEYELTQQGREQAQRENRKIGEEIINDARAKAEDVYAASVMYTDEALRRILDIMAVSYTHLDVYKRQA